MSYDAIGRLSQVSAGSTTKFAYSGDVMIAEYNSSNQVVARYVHGPGMDEPIVWYQGSGTATRKWLHADERGSVSALSDGSGVVSNINTYDPYGSPTASNQGRFQYTGQIWLSEVGLYYYRARFYSPTLGRFLQPDPIGYGDGLNMYAYVHGDPINSTDPSGLTTTDHCTDPQGSVDRCVDEIVIRPPNPCPADSCTRDPVEIANFRLVTREVNINQYANQIIVAVNDKARRAISDLRCPAWQVGGVLNDWSEKGAKTGLALAATGGLVMASVAGAPEGAALAGFGGTVMGVSGAVGLAGGTLQAVAGDPAAAYGAFVGSVVEAGASRVIGHQAARSFGAKAGDAVTNAVSAAVGNAATKMAQPGSKNPC